MSRTNVGSKGRVTNIQIPSCSTLEELRRYTEEAINVVAEVASNRDFPGDVSAQNNRLRRLSDPASGYDAVNLHTLEKKLDELEKKLTAKLHRPDLKKAFNFNDEEFEIVPGGFVIKGVDMTKSFNFDTDIFGNEVDFTLLENAINGNHIVENSINGNHILANSITGNHILANSITGNHILAHSITTLHLTVQEIDIGGSSGTQDKPIRLRIRDSWGNPIGWIGDDSQEHGGDTNYVGAWFKRALFGGDGSMANMKAMVDANGNMILKTVWVYDDQGATGFIGARTAVLGGATNTYYGGWLKEFYCGGTWSDELGPWGGGQPPFVVDKNGWLFIGGNRFVVDTNGNLNINEGTISVVGTSENLYYTGTETVVIQPGAGYVGAFQVKDVNSRTYVNPGGVYCDNSLYIGPIAYIYRTPSKARLGLFSSGVTDAPRLWSECEVDDGQLYFGIPNLARSIEFRVNRGIPDNNYLDVSNCEVRIGGWKIIDSAANFWVNNLNINGSFRLGYSSTPGYVLTADADGYGSWQAPSGGFSGDDHLLPSTSNTYDIGSLYYKWKDLFIAGDAIIGNKINAGGRVTASSYAIPSGSSDNIVIDENGTFYPRYYSGSSMPLLSNGELSLHYWTLGSILYLLAQDHSGNRYYIQFTPMGS